jgi:hypothetical protein
MYYFCQPQALNQCPAKSFYWSQKIKCLGYEMAKYRPGEYVLVNP